MKKFNLTRGVPGRMGGNSLRRKMKREPTIKITVLLLLTVILLTGCQTNTFKQKHFQARVARIHTIGLVPQVQTKILNTYFGNDHSPARFPDEEQIRTELTTATMTELQQRGFVVTESPQRAFTNAVFDKRLPVSKKPSKAEREDAKALAAGMNVDGLMVLNAAAFKSTPHREKITAAQNTLAMFILLASIAAGQPTDIHEPMQGAGVQVALIDGETGDVLWATGGSFDDFAKNKPAKDVKVLFSRYPKPKS